MKILVLTATLLLGAACVLGNELDFELNSVAICPVYDCQPDPLPCPNGVYKKDKNGCDTCECVCSPFICLIACEFGRQVDENGCDICRCKPKPPVCEHIDDCKFKRCKWKLENGCPLKGCPCESDCGPGPLCFVPCLHGSVPDEKGCPTCNCKCPKDLICPAIFCEFGYKTDINGCRTCECRDKPQCPIPLCKKPCIHGSRLDKNGCETCDCICPQVRCSEPCPGGFATDISGCQTCQCADECKWNFDCAAKLCPVPGPAIDANGCTLRGCPCTPPPAQCIPDPYDCPLDTSCPTGFKKDKNGCDTCECAPICLPVLCKRLCEHGFATDKNGCQICECLPDPEKPGSCPPSRGKRAIADLASPRAGCKSDSDCPGKRKCCTVGAQKRCRKPIRAPTKPGKCPARFGSITISPPCPADECKVDADCRGRKLCCGGCPRVCSRPELPPNPWGYE